MKKALFGVALVAALAAAGLFWAWHSLDVVVKYAIEHFAPIIAGVAVTVRDVQISKADGKGRLRGVEIGNPSGFTAPRAARLGEISVALDPGTLTAPVVVIHEIAIESPEITYEKGARLTNLEAIQRNIESQVARSGGGAPGAGPGMGRRYAIAKLSIRGARVTMTNPALKGQGITFTLPDIQLRDVGKPGQGVSAGQAANIVVGALVARIAQRALTGILR